MSENKPLAIVVAPGNINEYIRVYWAIKTFTDRDLDVPSMLVKVFFELMQSAAHYNMDQVYEKATDFSKIAVERLKPKKDYQFNWSDTILKEHDFAIKNDTAKIFSELICAFLLFDKDHNADKDDAIAFFYQAFDEEYKNKILPTDNLTFTPYKQAVISGILAMAVGFRLTTNANPTNEEIHQATRNAIRKYLKE